MESRGVEVHAVGPPAGVEVGGIVLAGSRSFPSTTPADSQQRRAALWLRRARNRHRRQRPLVTGWSRTTRTGPDPTGPLPRSRPVSATIGASCVTTSSERDDVDPGKLEPLRAPDRRRLADDRLELFLPAQMWDEAQVELPRSVGAFARRHELSQMPNRSCSSRCSRQSKRTSPSWTKLSTRPPRTRPELGR